MRRWVLALIVAAGCYHKAAENACTLTCSGPGSCPDGETCSAGMCAPPGVSCGSDGGIDADVPQDVLLDVTITTPDAPLCFGTVFPMCVDPGTFSGISLPASIDTDSSICTRTAVTMQGVPLCVVIGSDVVVPQITSAHGNHVLVVYAIDNFVLQSPAGLDIGTRTSGPSGPGADALCTTASNGNASAGGAGGSMLFSGGGGGVSPAGPGAGAIAGEVPTGLHGGCPGSVGLDEGGNADSIPGHGAGGIYIVAGQQITIGGYITAGGEGGQGGHAGVTGGGAGGGAGGMIVLDAPGIDLASAYLLANGGGGGGGSLAPVGTPGGPGGDSTGAFVAGGGTGASGGGGGGGGGGDGSTGAGGGGGGNGMSGGGGGGGGGYIKAAGMLTGQANTISPSLQP